MEPPRASSPKFLSTVFPVAPTRENREEIPHDFILKEAFADWANANPPPLPPASPPAALRFMDTIPIPPQSPFSGCEWNLFRPDYKGAIPPDGVSFQDFQQYESLYRAIVDGKTRLVILEDPHDNQFKARIFKCILMAFTKPSSRKLLLDLITFRGKQIKVMPGTKESTSYATFGPSKDMVEIRIGSEQCLLHMRQRLKEHYSLQETNDLTIIVLHELMHAYNMLRFAANWEEISSRRPRFRIDADTFEEELVIYAENQFRAEFGLPFRVGHGGMLAKSLQRPPQEHFFFYCYSGCVKEVAQGLANGMDPNSYFSVQKDRLTPLLAAASRGHFLVVDLLLSAGANPYLGSVKGMTLAHALIKAGDLSQLQKYHQSGVAVIVDHPRAVPLVHTALIDLKENSGSFIEYLMAHGANPYAFCPEGNTALHHAARLKNLSFFLNFQKLGLSEWIANHAGETPLHYALLSANHFLAQALLNEPGHPLALTKEGDTLFSYAYASFCPLTVGVLHEAQKRIQGIHSAQESNFSGVSPLYRAIKIANLPWQKEWIAHLITKGIPLSAFLSMEKPKETKLLVNMFVQTLNPIRAFMLRYIYRQHPGLIHQNVCFDKLLIDYASYKGDLELIRLSIELGAELNPKDRLPPLFLAIEYNQFASAETLISQGADKHQMYKGMTPYQAFQKRLQIPGACVNLNFLILLAP